MLPYMSDDAAGMSEDPSFELYAVSQHFGNLIGGHYATNCRTNTDTPGQSQWVAFNDESVLRVSAKDIPEKVIASTAYMLFYCRKD